MKNNFLSVSIVIATYNSSRTLERCLKSVRTQVFPQNKIEIIIADGGSTDGTQEIARTFKAMVISVDPRKQNAEYNKGIGIAAAKGDVLLLLDHDNILPHRKWLLNMIQPFIDNPKVTGVEPLRFDYDRRMTILDRYCALMGGSDPIVYYFGKDSHLSWGTDTYNLFGEVIDKGEYYLVRYSPDHVPALGGNAAALRRTILLKNADVTPDHFLHTDAVVELIHNGFDTFALTKDTIKHLTNNKLIPFLLRRKYFVDQYQSKKEHKRKFLVYDPATDKKKLLWYIFISLTIIIPLGDAIKGFLRIRDFAWFIHPFMCLAFLMIYGISVIQNKLKALSVFTKQ